MLEQQHVMTRYDLRGQGVVTQVNCSALVKVFFHMEIERDRQTDRHTDNDSRRQGVMTQVNCPALVKVFFDTDRQTDRQIDRRTDGRTDGQTGRQTGRQADRQKDRVQLMEAGDDDTGGLLRADEGFFPTETDRHTENDLWRQGVMTQVNCSELMRVFFSTETDRQTENDLWRQGGDDTDELL